MSMDVVVGAWHADITFVYLRGRRCGPERRGQRGGNAQRPRCALTPATTRACLVRAFEKFGNITDVFLPKDRETNEPRGFAFVTFEETRDAEDAIKEMDQ